MLYNSGVNLGFIAGLLLKVRGGFKTFIATFQPIVVGKNVMRSDDVQHALKRQQIRK